MSKATVLGKTTKADLPAELFGEEFHQSLVHEAARADLAARRRGTASTLRRGEVSMTTAKAWRQKGTGRARAGALSVPHRTGGGVAFGPKPRHYTVKVNRKARRRALRAALSVHADRDSVAVLDAATFEDPSTKKAAQALEKWGAAQPTLVILEVEETGALRSFRNIERVSVLDATAVGVADVIGAASIVISKEGVPHLTWYQLSGPTPNYLHIRYAVFKDNAWLARTLDFDNETGKWNSMVLDAQSNPLLSYSAWYDGELRLAHWNGKQWEFSTVDSRTRSHGEFNIGEGNSLILDSEGKPHISFYSEKALKYAHLVGENWKIETVDQFTWLGGWAHFRSAIVLDKQARPHICYDDAGLLKHAYWDGKQWHIQVLARNGMESLRYATMAIGRDDTIYIAFRDPEDNTLKLATGRPTPGQEDTASKKEEKQAVPQKQE